MMENEIKKLLWDSLLLDNKTKEKILNSFQNISKVKQVLLIAMIKEATLYQDKLIKWAIWNNKTLIQEIQTCKSTFIKNNNWKNEQKEIEFLDSNIDNLLNNL
jgi:hypothetical protein